MVHVPIRIEGTWVSGNVDLQGCSTNAEVKANISQHFVLDWDQFYLTQNGRLISDDQPLCEVAPISVVPRLLGGKGGFGSMLRAIGAQIEKTTNRDACRDLSGRRLRDINEEQRLKRWFAKQEEREREREEARQKKLEKLRKIQEGPALPLMDDQEYNKQRADMADSVFEAVDQGFEVAKSKKSSDSGSSSSDEKEVEVPTSSIELKKPKEVQKAVPPAKKKLKKTMLDEDLGSDLSSDDSELEDGSK